MPRDVFVSHASEDHALAEQVCALLEQRGLKCWIAPRDVGAGAEWDEAILDAIERCSAYLLILSAHANRSSFVKNELNRAFSVKKPIVTFRIEDVLPGRSLELYLARHHWTDAFPPPLEPRVDQLANSLTRLLNPPTDGSVDAPPSPVVPAPKPKRASLSTPARSAGGPRAWMAAFAVAVVVAAALAIPAFRHLRETPPPETRLEISTPATDQPQMFSLSPDGRQIVFVASGEGESRLWVRSLATTTAQPLPGTEGARLPFWSPDSRSIGFFARGALQRLDLGSGAPQVLASALNGLGGAWNADGIIVFTPSWTSPLMRVAAAGGAVTTLTTLDPQQQVHSHPHFLPDGRRFLFFVWGTTENSGIYLGALDGSTPTRLTLSDRSGEYLPSGWLLWVRSGTLVAQRLDLANASLTGEPVTLADGVASDNNTLRIGVSVAATGLLAYRTGSGSQRQLTWVDRSGTARGTVGDSDATFSRSRASPDGHRVLVDRTVQGNTDLWLLDGARSTRFTFDGAIDSYGLWSPDGTRIAFRSTRTGNADIYQARTNSTGGEERLLGSDQSKTPTSWSPDGRFLMYMSLDPQTYADLWVVPMEGEPMPSVFLKTPFREAYGAFSPDGRWVAYHSNESGRIEVYVRPFVPPGPAGAPQPGSGQSAGATGDQWQVSTAGGVYAKWRPDGKELYYLNPAGEMMAVPITVAGNTLEPGSPVVLFSTRIVSGGADLQLGWQYDVARDGRFLINTEVDGGDAAPITLIQNWHPEANKQ